MVGGNETGEAVNTSATFVASFPAGPWQTNCYLAATGPGEECVIIDPGMDAVAAVAELISQHRLKPVAVMVTHGHIDHMFSVTPLCRSYASSCWVHPADRGLLTDPLRASWPETRLLLERLTGGPKGRGQGQSLDRIRRARAEQDTTGQAPERPR